MKDFVVRNELHIFGASFQGRSRLRGYVVIKFMFYGLTHLYIHDITQIMHYKCCEFLKVDNRSCIAAEICFVKCKIVQTDKTTVTRRWFQRKHQEALLEVLREAVALYSVVRDDPVQRDQLLKSREATVRQNGPLKIAYVFKPASEAMPLLLEPKRDVAQDSAVSGGQFRSLGTDDVILTCSVALIGADGEDAGLGQLARPIGADTQPTVSAYFKPVAQC